MFDFLNVLDVMVLDLGYLSWVKIRIKILKYKKKKGKRREI